MPAVSSNGKGDLLVVNAEDINTMPLNDAVGTLAAGFVTGSVGVEITPPVSQP